MKRWIHISIHILLWALALWMVLPRPMPDGVAFWAMLVTPASTIVMFYYCYSLAWPCLNRKGKRWLTPVLLVIVPPLYWLCLFVLHRFVYLVAGLPPTIRTYGDTTMYASEKVITLVILAGAVWGIQAWSGKRRENRLLEKENEKMEMDYLQMQFNPHFLLNMLNNLYICAAEVSEELALQVKRVADLMTYAIRIHSDGLVPLSIEVEHILNYTEIFRMRFGPRFHAEVEVEGSNEDLQIPPLLLMPFVENAFKHGVVTDPQRPVRVQLKTEGNTLWLTVQNIIAQHNYKDSTGGVGLPSIRRRLALIYPGKHTLKITEQAEVYTTNLQIIL
ncbi:histidine kinase [Chitinophaga sp.]|uniref:sensor histidine kinase n=1 Tax=Chitinophaga sp. TaxID=1869181 RepID=UPI0031E43B74